jgi:hypothetical protein
MAPNPVYYQLKNILTNMVSGQMIDVIIEERLNDDIKELGCSIIKPNNNTWETNNYDGEMDLETFIEYFLTDNLISVRIDNEIDDLDEQ